ncbi:MAG: hypothetical protein ABII23_00270 [bacterium]
MMYRKGITVWFPGHVKRILRRTLFPKKPVHIILMFTYVFDEFNRFHKNMINRFLLWEQQLCKLAQKHQDSDGKPPVCSFFVPILNYDTQVLLRLSALCQKGLGEIELYLPESVTASESVQKMFLASLDILSTFGISHSYNGESKKNKRFFSVWCNPHRVTDADISFLHEHGCYADFSLPHVNRASRFTNNQLYYYAPLSYAETKEKFLHVPGAAGINYFDLRNIYAPRTDSGFISMADKPSVLRSWLWEKNAPGFSRKPDWRVIRLNARPFPEDDHANLIGRYLDRFYTRYEKNFRKNPNTLHYVSGRELCNIITAGENGEKGSPSACRDGLLPRYINQQIYASKPFMVEHIERNSFHLRILDNAPSSVYCNVFPVFEFHGHMQTIQGSLDNEHTQINIRLEGKGVVAMKGRTASAVTNVSGARIISLSEEGHNSHEIHLETEVRTCQLVSITLLS